MPSISKDRKKPIKPLLQIKQAEIAKYRTMFATKQGYICPICGNSLATGIVALDHNHKGHGELRGTLHSSCNSSIGRMEHGAKHLQKVSHISKTNFIVYLENTLNFLKSTEENPSHLVHPTFDLTTMKQKPKKRTKRNARK